MAAPTTIRSLSATDLNIPLHAPFGIAGGVQDLGRNLLVTVELDDGTRGYGEAAPLPPFNGETQAIARAAIAAAASTVEGADVREWRKIATALRSAIGPIGSAQCAIETAILDALTRRANMPLWVFFGGVGTSLETGMTVTTGSVKQAAADARAISARGIRTATPSRIIWAFISVPTCSGLRDDGFAEHRIHETGTRYSIPSSGPHDNSNPKWGADFCGAVVSSSSG